MARKSMHINYMSTSLLTLVRQVRRLFQALGGLQTLVPRASLVTALPHPLSPAPAAAIAGGYDLIVPRLARDMPALRIPLLALDAPPLTPSGAPGQARPDAATLPLPASPQPHANTPAPPLPEGVTLPHPAALPPSGDTWHLHLATPLDEDTVRNDLIPLLNRLRETG